jgi:hypothetical protein
MSTADANYRSLQSVSCRHPSISQQEKRTCLDALPATARLLIFARRGMLTGLAASLLQDVWKSIGGGVLVLWWEVCDQAMLSFGAGWIEDLGYAEGEVQKVAIIDSPVGRKKRV